MAKMNLLILVFVFGAFTPAIGATRICLKHENETRIVKRCPMPKSPLEIRQENQALLNRQVLAIDKDGLMLDPVTLCPVKDSVEVEKRMKQIIDTAIAGVKSGAYARIVFFIHGGLNSYQSSIGRAITVTDSMQRDSVDKAYPIFIVWNSNILSTYWEHLWRIRQGRVMRRMEHAITPVAAPLVFSTDLLTGIARIPVDILASGLNDARTAPTSLYDKPIDMVYEEWHERMLKHGDSTFKVAKGEDKRNVVDKTLRGVNYFLALPMRWLSLPLIDGLGAPNWNIMLRRTNTLFRANSEFDLEHITPGPKNEQPHLDSKPDGALAKMLAYLQDEVKGGSKVRIDLIGHSMGAIVANQILEYVPDVHFERIVYLAAACSVRDMNQWVLSYMAHRERQDSTRVPHFYNLTLHPVAERRETFDIPVIGLLGVDWVLRGTLLEWIDHYFAKPNNPDERTLGKYENIYACLHMVPEKFRGRMTIKTFGVKEWSFGTKKFRESSAEPQKHGSFSDFKFWQEGFWRVDLVRSETEADTTNPFYMPDSLGNRL